MQKLSKGKSNAVGSIDVPSTQLAIEFVSATVTDPTQKELKVDIREPLGLLQSTKSFTLLERRLYLLVLREIKSIQKINPDAIQTFHELNSISIIPKLLLATPTSMYETWSLRFRQEP